MNPLAGKHALVTGAASGIGRAVLYALHDAGAAVVGLDRSMPSETAHHFVTADVSDEDQVERAVAEAARHLGAIDILVNSAGVMPEASLADTTVADFDLAYAVNVRGTFLVSRAVLRHMPDGGRIINIASELAHLGRAGLSAYCASKAAVLGLTRSWARELAPKILVNAVAPGPTDTPLLGFERLSDDQRALEVANPLGRIGRPEEIASGIVYLASPQASFVTGQCLGIDGGAAMK